MSHPNFLNIASIISRTRGDSGSSLTPAQLWPHFLLLPTCPLEVAPILYYAVDSVFQSPIFTISSTAAPQKCAGGACHAKGMHHEVVQQLCRPQINGLAGRPSYGLLKEVDGTGNLSIEKPGTGARRSRPIQYAMRQRCTP